jgi:hypothetical protein
LNLRWRTLGALVAVVVTGVGSAAHSTPTPVAVPPGWPEHRDVQKGFELRLPPGWKAGTSFLRTPAFRRLRARLPRVAAQYAEMLRKASRNGVWFIAIDTSAFATSHALNSTAGSYGLFPAIFVMPERVARKVYVGAATRVVPADWRGRVPDTNRSNCDASFDRLPICLDVYETFRGDLYIDLWHVMHRPAGRTSLVAGFARGQNIDPSGTLLGQPSQAVWEAARESVRYT